MIIYIYYSIFSEHLGTVKIIYTVPTYEIEYKFEFQ